MNYFIEEENRDGVRFSWSVFPTSPVDVERMAVPIGCVYTPLKQIPGMPQVAYHPVVCKATNCDTILNPCCRVDFENKTWVCPLCLTTNHFPHHYAGMSRENRVAEIIPQYTTMEYILDSNIRAPVFLFVIDTCIHEDDLKQIKISLFEALLLLPPNSLVGLVTFGKNVHVHELSFDECPKSYVFRGDRESTSVHIANSLDLHGSMTTKQLASKCRFLIPISECEYQLCHILEGLKQDVWNHKQFERPLRCTGAALSACVSILENACKDSSGRIMMFLGGPATYGPGMIASTQRKEHVRSQKDIDKGDAPFYKPAMKFYEGVAARAVCNGHTIDLFECSLEDVGLAEMRVCVEKTGGYMLYDVFWTRGVFLESFKRIFARDNTTQLTATAAAQQPSILASQQPTDLSYDLAMSFHGELTVLCSRELKVCGAIGHVTSLNRKKSSSESVSEIEIGVGQTCAWTLGGLDRNSTLSIYFDIVDQNADDDALSPASASASATATAAIGTCTNQCYMQFVTRYRHSSGRTHLRVSTISKRFAQLKSDQSLTYFRAGFDQEAAAVLIARLAVHKTLTEKVNSDILHWIDRILIRLVSMFATYKKDDTNSFHLSSQFSYYPQFMFHLRRSKLLFVDHSPPDETAFHRTILLRENVTNSLLIIQPALLAYSFKDPSFFDVPCGREVLLSLSSRASDRILVLDTFFHIVISVSETIEKWRKAGYHESPEYAHFAEFLSAPKRDAQILIDSRFPVPCLEECVEHHGRGGRFLNGKAANLHTPALTGQEPPVSEEVPLKEFLIQVKATAMKELIYM